MSVNTTVSDGGSIGATKKKIKQLDRESPEVFDAAMFKFMQKVYSETLNQMQTMGIRDTGALMASTRLDKQGGGGTIGMVSRKDNSSQWRVVSGGGGVINRKNAREVDYAKPVHDGYATRGRWVPGRPYLDVAWAAMEPQWKKHLTDYLKWIESEWQKDQSSANRLSITGG